MSFAKQSKHLEKIWRKDKRFGEYLGSVFKHPHGKDLLISALLAEGLEGGVGEDALRHLRSHFLAVLGEQVHVLCEG